MRFFHFSCDISGARRFCCERAPASLGLGGGGSWFRWCYLPSSAGSGNVRDLKEADHHLRLSMRDVFLVLSLRVLLVSPLHVHYFGPL
jgi:hypothetical protein